MPSTTSTSLPWSLDPVTTHRASSASAILALCLSAGACGTSPAPVDGGADSAPADAEWVDGDTEPDGDSPIWPDGDSPTWPDGDVDERPDADEPGWGPCTVGDVDGVCLDVSACDGISTPGHCPGPDNIQCCTPTAAEECDPEARPTPNAGLTEDAGVGGCPPGMLPVETFCIDRYEASLVEVHSDGSESSWSPYWNPEGRRVRALSLAGAAPQGYISGDQAGAACAEAGKRLCTDDEWLRTCQGPAGTTYPYGETLDPGLCNDARARHPAIEYFGTSDDWIWSRLGHPCLSQLPDSLDRTGANADCVTAEGAFDMMGNLHEWTADPAGTFRGGFYVDTVINGSGCLYRTTAHSSGYWDYSTGFRCCAD